jgi:hypothetical protein
MGDELRDPGQPGAGDPLRVSLKELGDTYEPDLAAIYRRLDTRHTGGATARTRQQRCRATARPGRPRLYSVLALIVLLVGVARATVLDAPGAGSTQTAGIPVGVQTAPASTGSPRSAQPTQSQTTQPTQSQTSQPQTSQPQASRPTRTRTRTAQSGQTTRTTRTTRPGRSARVTVETLDPTTTRSVKLGGAGLLDWLALGTRPDLQQVRARGGAAAALITVEQPATATSEPSPFRTSWTGGLPEPARTGASTWLRFKGPQEVSVTLAPSERARTVVLYTGTKDVHAALSINGPGLVTESTPIGIPSAEPQTFVVTVSVPATTGPTRLRLGGTSIRPTSGLYVAAATVS